MASISHTQTPEHLPYPSTPSWNTLQATLARSSLPESPITLVGTVKIHGANISLIYDHETHWLQSRNRVISRDNDMQGACAWPSSKIPNLHSLISSLSSKIMEPISQYAIYGEYAGRGIQCHVGVDEIPRFYSIFAVMINHTFLPSSIWKDILHIPDQRVWNAYDFPCFEVLVDWSSMTGVYECLAILTEKTLEVERQCPVAKQFGVDGTGEGIVWSVEGVVEVAGGNVKQMDSPKRSIIFKTKGHEHVAGNKTDVNDLTKKLTRESRLQSRLELFLEQVLTPGRYAQGFDYLMEMNIPATMSSLKEYQTWILEDIIKEEQHLIQVEFEVSFEPARKRIMREALLHYKAVVLNELKEQ